MRSDGEDAMLEFEAVGAIFAFDAYFLVVDEPADTMYIVDMVAGYQTAHSFRQPVNDPLLP